MTTPPADLGAIHLLVVMLCLATGLIGYALGARTATRSPATVEYRFIPRTYAEELEDTQAADVYRALAAGAPVLRPTSS